MLLTIAIILIVLWLLGLISSYTLGGWIHLLLIAAIIAFVVQLIAGPRRAVGLERVFGDHRWRPSGELPPQCSKFQGRGTRPST